MDIPVTVMMLMLSGRPESHRVSWVVGDVAEKKKIQTLIDNQETGEGISNHITDFEKA